jgi:hypothetical protein
MSYGRRIGDDRRIFASYPCARQLSRAALHDGEEFCQCVVRPPRKPAT